MHVLITYSEKIRSSFVTTGRPVIVLAFFVIGPMGLAHAIRFPLKSVASFG